MSRTFLCNLTLLLALVIASDGAINPASALCKYGTPHCVKNPKPVPPKIGGIKQPDNGWVDPDCKDYPGLCSSPTPKTNTTPVTHPTTGATKSN
jgi:hypothetical protein